MPYLLHDLEIGDDLVVTRISRGGAGAGKWVRGRLNGYRFDALVFPEHATSPDYELEQSTISKLLIQRLADRQTVVHFERGWDVRPTSDEAAAIMDFLAAGLAEHIYGPNA